jgi:hypothetical protein
MSVQLENLFLDARPALQGSVFEVASRLLKDPAARLVSEEPSHEEVRELLPTLRARAANAYRSGARIVGLSFVIRRLESLPGQARVIGYGVTSPRANGNIYFSAVDRTPLGTAIIER